MEYTRNLIKFRNENSIFRSHQFVSSLTYHYDNGLYADPMNSGYWNNPADNFFGALINSSQNRIYIASNKSDGILNISLPQNQPNQAWYKCMDSSDFKNCNFEPKDYIEKDYILNPQALAIFMEK